MGGTQGPLFFPRVGATHYLATILALLGLLGCSGNPNSGQLELRVLTTEVRIPWDEDWREPCEGSCPEIIYCLINNTDQDLMLYDFNRDFQYTKYGLNEIPCDTVMGIPEMTVFVYDKHGEPRIGSYSTHDGMDTMTYFANYESYEKASLSWYRNSRVIVPKGEKIEFKRKIDFRVKFNRVLSEDTFYVKLSCMQKSVWMEDINPDLLKQDLNGAVLFNGCLISNDLRLIIGTPKKKPESIFLEEVEVMDSSVDRQ